MLMPTDACLYFHECNGCSVLIRPRPGDCCIFCSYGTVVCPPMQSDDPICCAFHDISSIQPNLNV
jgi:hypothetical protein